MRKQFVIVMYSIFLLVLGMGLAPVVESASRSSATEAQLLTGNTWQTLSRDR
jgi:hypothetical protein